MALGADVQRVFGVRQFLAVGRGPETQGRDELDLQIMKSDELDNDRAHQRRHSGYDEAFHRR
jgi:hypothetical protein